MIVNDVGPNAVPLYAGDNANDADSMETVRALGGISIGIGPQAPTAAACRLSDTSALAAFLQAFLEKIEPLVASAVSSSPGT